MCDTNVMIMGTEWKIRYHDSKDDPGLNGADGYTDASTRLIVIRTDNTAGAADWPRAQKAILRHELIHAFLFESGIAWCYSPAQKYGHDEAMVDWFARKFPQIMTVYEHLDIAYD